jgi:hypothetical protein
MAGRIKRTSPSQDKDVPTGVIYFGKNCRGCPICKLWSHWVATHSKHSWGMIALTRPGIRSLPLMWDSIEFRH